MIIATMAIGMIILRTINAYPREYDTTNVPAVVPSLQDVLLVSVLVDYEIVIIRA